MTRLRSEFTTFMITRFWLWVVLVAILFGAALSSAFAQQADPVRDQIVRVIGEQAVSNAQCSAQVMGLNAEVDKLKKELADLKAKGEPKK